MILYDDITIVQYNVNKSRDKVQRHFLQELDPLRHHVIAVQEPWINPYVGLPATCNDRRYHTVIAGQRGVIPRTCIYVSKTIDLESWKVILPQQGNLGDITSIQIDTTQGPIQIHNVYNPLPRGRTSRELGTLAHLERTLSQDTKQVLLGDFNLHHPQWGLEFTPPHAFLGGKLLDITARYGMALVTPKGTETWKARTSASTIDLCFLSRELEERLVQCRPNYALEASSDHIPIQTTLGVKAIEEPANEPRRN
uniref:Endonuclease/exonuclease/phosphatase domain-containing protein n=1 Tax=Passalora fulva TaxID=5499 RepID=A0A9Q8L8Q9_PASFU